MSNGARQLSKLKQLLASSTGEREACAFFRKHPGFLYWTFCHSGHTKYVFAEFPLGSEFKADFVLLNSYSGAWEVYFVELEPIVNQLFTKKRTPTSRLAMAMRQVDDWREYVDRNPGYLRSELVRWAKNHDLLGLSDRDEPCNYSGDRLADPKTVILERFLIVIGRSSRLDQEQRQLLGRVSRGHRCEVVTYDRVLDQAEKMYGSRKDPERWFTPPAP